MAFERERSDRSIERQLFAVAGGDFGWIEGIENPARFRKRLDLDGIPAACRQL
jgi:hypothetical protein